MMLLPRHIKSADRVLPARLFFCRCARPPPLARLVDLAQASRLPDLHVEVLLVSIHGKTFVTTHNSSLEAQCFYTPLDLGWWKPSRRLGSNMIGQQDDDSEASSPRSCSTTPAIRDRCLHALRRRSSCATRALDVDRRRDHREGGLQRPDHEGATS